MAECGECSLCCKLLGVVELEKPAAKWCTHCKPGAAKPCQIYDTRPPTCQDFECGWLANDGDPHWRPDRIHMVITGESERLNAYVVHVDPAYPDAYKQKMGEALLKGLVKLGRHPNIVLVIGEKRKYIGDEQTVRRALEKAELEGKESLT